MNSLSRSLAIVAAFAVTHIHLEAQERQQLPNPKIDYPGFLEDARTVAKLREERRITEQKFIEMAADPGTVILDARSAARAFSI